MANIINVMYNRVVNTGLCGYTSNIWKQSFTIAEAVTVNALRLRAFHNQTLATNAVAKILNKVTNTTLATSTSVTVIHEIDKMVLKSASPQTGFTDEIQFNFPTLISLSANSVYEIELDITPTSGNPVCAFAAYNNQIETGAIFNITSAFTLTGQMQGSDTLFMIFALINSDGSTNLPTFNPALSGTESGSSISNNMSNVNFILTAFGVALIATSGILVLLNQRRRHK